MLPDRVSLKEYVMQKQEIIFMIFQQRFRNMRRALVMELCVSLLAMALAHICMKIRKFQTLRTIGRGIRLRPGMTLAIEPMITMGDYAVSVLDDDWTVVTDDNSLAAHYENTVLITEEDPEILTLPNWDKKEWQ